MEHVERQDGNGKSVLLSQEELATVQQSIEYDIPLFLEIQEYKKYSEELDALNRLDVDIQRPECLSRIRAHILHVTKDEQKRVLAPELMKYMMDRM